MSFQGYNSWVNFLVNLLYFTNFAHGLFHSTWHVIMCVICIVQILAIPTMSCRDQPSFWLMPPESGLDLNIVFVTLHIAQYIAYNTYYMTIHASKKLLGFF